MGQRYLGDLGQCYTGFNTLGQAWYLGDALGSVRTTLDSAGAVQATASYAPFGEPQGSSIAPFGFTGELQDQGLVNLRARWYDPRSGVFTSVDPFTGFPETPYSLNPYQYAYSAPTTWTDPSGEIVWVVVGVVAVGAVILTIGVVNDTTAIQSNPRAFDAAGFEIVPWEEAIPNTIDRVRTDAPKGATLVYSSCAEALESLIWLGTDGDTDEPRNAVPSSDTGGQTAGPGGVDPEDDPDLQSTLDQIRGEQFKQVYSGLRSSPQWKADFVRSGRTLTDRIKNREVLMQLRTIEKGNWVKAYTNGHWRGERYSYHYFRSPSGRVTGVKFKRNWVTLK